MLKRHINKRANERRFYMMSFQDAVKFYRSKFEGTQKGILKTKISE
ncbi:hypothetical protein UNH65_21245 [Chitinophaga sp. 180180018-2]|nr:hypothetical protein [Chitinophaga sp. 212800010-3]